MRWFWAFLMTQAIEVPIYVVGARVGALLAFGATAITHPIVFFVFPRVWPGGYWSHVAAAEAFAVGVEALYLTRLGARRPLAWALAANLSSAGLGLLSRRVFGWP